MRFESSLWSAQKVSLGSAGRAFEIQMRKSDEVKILKKVDRANTIFVFLAPSLDLNFESSRKVIQTFYTPVVEYIIVRLTDVRFESSLTFPLIKLCKTFHKTLLITKIVRINQFLKSSKKSKHNYKFCVNHDHWIHK